MQVALHKKWKGMATNKLAIIRYRVIDEALQGGRKVKAEELLEKIATKLAEYDLKGIARRQLSDDIKAMRENEELGYKADIKGGKYGYWYEDPHYSIMKCPINKDDTNRINEALITLEQFKHFGFYKELHTIIQKVSQQTHIRITPLQPIIHFETVETYEGNKHLAELYQAIIKKEVLYVTYTPFNNAPELLNFHPHLLKEYNNRWFLFGIDALARDKTKRFRILPLDRITKFFAKFEDYISAKPLEIENFFKHIIGVGLPWEDQTLYEICIRIKQPRGKYILTKPLHTSQEVIEETELFLTIRLQLIPTREMYAQFLSYGEDMEVLSPPHVRNQLKEHFTKAMALYEND